MLQEISWALLVGSLYLGVFDYNEIDVTPSTPNLYGIQNRAHTLPMPFFNVAATLASVLAIISWYRVLIKYWLPERTLSETMCDI